MEQGPDKKEWALLEKLLMETHKENKRARRWGIFFKLIAVFYVFLLLGLLAPEEATMPHADVEHTAMVEVKGVISPNTDANADSIVSGLRKAFEAENSRAIVMRINSPGGSPVQSGYVFDEVMRLKEKHPEKKVYAVITDLGASGAYYIASSADEIYVDKASLVGSIGVIMGGFGFEKAIEKLGIERRVMTAGENKAIMDPFSPIEPEQKAHVQRMLDNIHEQFIAVVKHGRGSRISEDPKVFSGLFWTGEQALELGLADALGSTGYVAREIVGAEKVVDYTRKPDPFERFARSLGASAGTAMGNVLASQGGWTLQ